MAAEKVEVRVEEDLGERGVEGGEVLGWGELVGGGADGGEERAGRGVGVGVETGVLDFAIPLKAGELVAERGGEGEQGEAEGDGGEEDDAKNYGRGVGTEG